MDCAWETQMTDDRLVLHGSFTSSSTYKPMLFLALAGLPFSFRTVDPAVMDFFRPPAEAALDFVEKSLEGRQWLVGESCTIADIGCWGRMVFMAEGGMSLEARPNARAWRDRLIAMPGFALPYDL